MVLDHEHLGTSTYIALTICITYLHPPCLWSASRLWWQQDANDISLLARCLFAIHSLFATIGC